MKNRCFSIPQAPPSHGNLEKTKENEGFWSPKAAPGYGNLEKTKENEGFGSLRPSPKLLFFFVSVAPPPLQNL